jgi:arginyl-tRNA synthetase
MNIFKDFKDLVEAKIEDLSKAGTLPAALDLGNLALEPPRDPSHGDLATNAAMVLAKQPLVELLSTAPGIAEAAVAGPGFINMRLEDSLWHDLLPSVLAEGLAYGDSRLGQGEKVNVEYVSANPTGPLHLGHVRGAVFGDALAALLEKAGYDVTREYVINDAGSQIDTLARSLHLRYREALGEDIGVIPEGMYPGDYLVPAAAALVERDGEKWRNADEAEWLAALKPFAVDRMMDLIRADLAELGVRQEVYFSENTLHLDRRIDDALAALEQKGLIYTGILEPPKGKRPDDWEPRPQTLFKASEFGDDTDRPLKKSDGSWTYFAADIAYHYDKYQRGFAQQIDVWGADHGGYVKRMRAAVTAMSDGKAELDVRLCQMVRLMRGGEPVKMSKRAGDFVTLRDLLDEVGRDVIRFFMLTRKNDAPLDFDFEKVTEQSKDNPVFYVQYAHARICSVFRNVAEQIPGLTVTDEMLANADVARLSDPAELDLIKRIGQWPRQVETAAQAHEPHRIAFFLHDLAGDFHALWNKGNDNPDLRFIQPEDTDLTAARLAMLRAVAVVIASGLQLMGVTPVEEMR